MTAEGFSTLRAAKFHEKRAQWQNRQRRLGEVGVAVDKSRLLVCLIRNTRALSE